MLLFEYTFPEFLKIFFCSLIFRDHFNTYFCIIFKKIEEAVLDSFPSTEYPCNQQVLSIMDFLLKRL